jgi:hypothetical protein
MDVSRVAESGLTRMTETNKYVLAKKLESTGEFPDWVDRLTAIPGVELISSSVKRAYIRATPEAIAVVRGQFSNDFHIEGVVPRSTQA